MAHDHEKGPYTGPSEDFAVWADAVRRSPDGVTDPNERNIDDTLTFLSLDFNRMDADTKRGNMGEVEVWDENAWGTRGGMWDPDECPEVPQHILDEVREKMEEKQKAARIAAYLDKVNSPGYVAPLE